VAEILTRDRYACQLGVKCQAVDCPKQRLCESCQLLLAHDAALRAEIERSHDAILHLTGEIERLPEEAFLRGASWAYETLTGALIVPASFEQQARAAIAGEKEKKP